MTPEIMKLLFSITKAKYDGAKKGSIEHHEDGAGRTKENWSNFSLEGEDCALCKLFGEGGICSDNQLCSLYEDNSRLCNSAWRGAASAQETRNYTAFHAAELAQVAILKSLPPYDEWMAEHVRKLKGQEIECKYSHYTAKHYQIPDNRKAIFIFTGKYRQANYECVYDLVTGSVCYFPCKSAFEAPILEFVRIVGEPEKTRYVGVDFAYPNNGFKALYMESARQAEKVLSQQLSVPYSYLQCDSCAHEFEPTKAEKRGYQVGDEFVYHERNPHHKAKIWDDMLCKFIRIDDHVEKGEMSMVHKDDPDEMYLDSSGFIDGFRWSMDSSFYSKRFDVVQCIDPRWLAKQAKQPEFKVDNIVMSHYTDNSENGLRKISAIDGNVAFFTIGTSASFSQITLATPAEALKWYEDEYTVERNGVLLRAYETEDGGIRVSLPGGKYWLLCANFVGEMLILKALGLPIIPFKISQGIFTSP